jgi:hypothetical protein
MVVQNTSYRLRTRFKNFAQGQARTWWTSPGGVARPPRPHAATAVELAAHEKFLAETVEDPIWKRE